jgi:DSF synthase
VEQLTMDLSKFQQEHIKVSLDPEAKILWATVTGPGYFSRSLIDQTIRLQLELLRHYDGLPPEGMPFRWLVWRSSVPKVFSLGGDLDFFVKCHEDRNWGALWSYCQGCTQIASLNYGNIGKLPVSTVAFVEGDAFGGGFEAALSCDMIIASGKARFGFPETLFGLFPGMGGYSLTMRRAGAKEARSLIEDARNICPEEAGVLGLVDHVVYSTKPTDEVTRILAGTRPDTYQACRRAAKRVNECTPKELLDIVRIWFELVKTLGPAEIKRMRCLARVQERRTTPTVTKGEC